MSDPIRIFVLALGPGDRGSAPFRAAIPSIPLDAVYACDEDDAEAVLQTLDPIPNVTVHMEPRFCGTSREALRAQLASVANAYPGGTVLALVEASVAQTLVAALLDAPEDGGRVWCAPFAITVLEAGPDGRGVLRALSADAALPTPQAGTTRVALVRHGHAMNPNAGVFSHNPIPLSAIGRAEAERAATALASLGVDVIYSSDIVRARETAQICGRALGLEVGIDEGLRELRIGDFEGTTIERVRAADAAFLPWLEVTFRDRFPTNEYHHPAELRFPNGQSVLDNHDISLESFRRIVRKERDRTVAIVSHGWVLQPLLCHIVGVDPHDYFRFTLPTAAIAVADVDGDGRGVLRVFNAGIDAAGVPRMIGPVSTTETG